MLVAPQPAARRALFRILTVVGVLSFGAGLSAPVTAQTAPPKAQRFGAWGLECPKGPDSCRLSQRVAADPQGKTIVLGVMGDARRNWLQFRFSPDAAFDQGVGIRIDSGKPARYPMHGCDNKICEARVPVSAALLKSASTAKTMTFAFIYASGQQISLPVAMDGFTRGWAALRAVSCEGKCPK